MKKILYGIALLPLLASCSQNNEMLPEVNPNEIEINVSVEALTRVVTDGMASRFENGDEIMVYGWTGDRNGVSADAPIASVNAFDGTKLTATPQMLWQSRTAAHWFLGIYLNVGRDAITLDNVTISDWESQGDAIEGEAQNYIVNE